MAVSGLPSVNPRAIQPQTVNRDVSAAQRAFFQAALARTGAASLAAASEPAAATPLQAPAPARAAVAPEPAAEPARHYRPGSLLDIKI